MEDEPEQEPRKDPPVDPEVRQKRFVDYMEKQEVDALMKLKDAVKLKSIAERGSEGMEKMTSFLTEEIEAAGGSVRLVDGDAPVILATVPAKLADDVPTILVVGNYDVGSTAAEKEFELQEEEGILMGPGCATKAPLLAWINAAQCFFEVDQKPAPVNLKFLFSGGNSLEEVMQKEAQAGKFLDRIDLIVGTETSWLHNPTIFIGARGATTYEVSIAASANDSPLSMEHAGSVTEPLAELLDLVNSFKVSTTSSSGNTECIGSLIQNPPSVETYRSQVNMSVKSDSAEEILADKSRSAVCFHSISAQECSEFEIPRSAAAKFTVLSTKENDGNAERLLKNLYSGKHQFEVRELSSCPPWGNTPVSSPYFTKLKKAIESFHSVAPHVAVDGAPHPLIAPLAKKLSRTPAFSLPICLRKSKEDAVPKDCYVDFTKILVNFIEQVGKKMDKQPQLTSV